MARRKKGNLVDTTGIPYWKYLVYEYVIKKIKGVNIPMEKRLLAMKNTEKEAMKVLEKFRRKNPDKYYKLIYEESTKLYDTFWEDN